MYSTNVPGIEAGIDMTLDQLASVENISVRSLHVLRSLDLDTLRAILNYRTIYTDFLGIRNCGVKSNDELLRICHKYLEHFSRTEKGDVISAAGNTQSVSLFGTEKEKMPDIDPYSRINEIITGTGRIPVFKLVDLLIDNHTIFRREKVTLVFKRIFRCYDSLRYFTMTETGRELGMTKERVRQIKEHIVQNFRQTFRFLQTEAYDTLFINYIENPEKPIILLTDEEIRKINEQEGTRFSGDFITFLLSLIYAGQTHFNFLESPTNSHCSNRHPSVFL